MKKSVAFALALAVAACGCTKVRSTGSHARHAWTQAGVLRVGAYEEPDSLNPVIGSMAFASDIYQLIFDGLIRFDEKGRPVPDLAKEVPSLHNGGISKDGKTLTYHLVENARWHDGVPLTADDVIFTYRQLMNPENSTPNRSGYDRIAAIWAPDAHTVRLRLKEPYAPAIYLFRNLSQGAILPKHVLQKYRDLNRVPFNALPIGSGPFVFKAWHHGSDMIFEANPQYFRGPPKLKRIHWKFIRDQNTLLAQLRTHEIDLYYDVPSYQYPALKAIPDIALTTVSTLHWEHLVFNVRRPPLDERRVRLALVHALDEDAIYANIYHGLGTKGPTDQNPDYGWFDPAIGYYPHDLRKAGELLEAAGWRRASDGFRYRGAKRLGFTLSTVAGVKSREALEVLLQSAWREAGADVTIKNYPAATLFAPAKAGGIMYAGKADALIFTWVNSTPDPDDETYIGPDRIPPRGQNVMFYANPALGRAQREALRTYDPVRRHRLYNRIQEEIIRDVPEYNFNWLPEIDAANVDLVGLKPVPVGSDFWNIAEWSL